MISATNCRFTNKNGSVDKNRKRMSTVQRNPTGKIIFQTQSFRVPMADFGQYQTPSNSAWHLMTTRLHHVISGYLPILKSSYFVCSCLFHQEKIISIWSHMRTMVLEYLYNYQHLPQKSPSFVGFYIPAPCFASGVFRIPLSAPLSASAVLKSSPPKKIGA